MPRPGTGGGGHRSSGGHSSSRVGGGHHVGSSSRPTRSRSHRMDLAEVIIVNPHQEESTMVTMAIEEMFIQVHQVV